MTPNGLQPGERYWRLIEPVWRAVSIYEGSAVFLDQFGRLRPEVGHLLAAHWCQSEVRNGGLHQFFMNSTGVLAPEAAAGFTAIGIGEWAAVLTEAIGYFGPDYPRPTGERQQVLLMIPKGPTRDDWDPFSKLDDRFYAWLRADESDRWCRVADEYAGRVGG
jgi:hypothetical protein